MHSSPRPPPKPYYPPHPRATPTPPPSAAPTSAPALPSTSERGLLQPAPGEEADAAGEGGVEGVRGGGGGGGRSRGPVLIIIHVRVRLDGPEGVLAVHVPRVGLARVDDEERGARVALPSGAIRPAAAASSHAASTRPISRSSSRSAASTSAGIPPPPNPPPPPPPPSTPPAAAAARSRMRARSADHSRSK
jgi:hypothetical protein